MLERVWARAPLEIHWHGDARLGRRAPPV